MAQMGPKTRRDAELLSGKDRGYLQPPGDASELYVLKWWSIVEDFDPGYFKECDRILLDAYLHSSIRHDIANLQMMGQPMIIFDPKTEKETPHPLLSVINKEIATMNSIATKLRVCPSARVQATQVKNTKHGMQERKARGRGQPASNEGTGNILRLA